MYIYLILSSFKNLLEYEIFNKKKKLHTLKELKLC